MERHKSPKELENESNIEKLKAEVLEMYAKEREREREKAIENYFSQKDLKFVNEYIVFLTQLNLYLNHFPRHEKFALSSQIRNRAYEVYELMIQSRKKWHKKTSLTNLDMSLELLKMDIYLAPFSEPINSDILIIQKNAKRELKAQRGMESCN